MPDEPKDPAVTRGRDESLRYEGGHIPGWRRPAQREQSTSLPNQEEKQNTLLSTTVPRCTSIYREPMIAKWRKLSSGVGGARGEPRSRKLPQGDSGEKQRRNHSQRASGERRKGSNKGKRLRREVFRRSGDIIKRTERAQPTAGEKSTANRRQSDPKGCDRDKDEVNKAKDFSKTVIEQGCHGDTPVRDFDH